MHCGTGWIVEDGCLFVLYGMGQIFIVGIHCIKNETLIYLYTGFDSCNSVTTVASNDIPTIRHGII